MLFEIASRDRAGLTRALAPSLEDLVKQVVGRDRQAFGALLAPALGPAIRQSVSDALRAFTQFIERAIELSLSPKSWAWRIEALRTGRSFSEVALCHMLRFQAEYVFLVQRQTRFLLPLFLAKRPSLLGHASESLWR